MQWYHDKSLCPWHLKIFTQFAHPVSRVNHTFPLQICQTSLGVSWVTSPFHRHLSPPRMFSDFLLRKGPLQMAGFSPLFPWGTFLIRHHNLDAP